MGSLKTDWPAGVKKTKQRECVLALLERAEKPLSAMEIYSQVDKTGVSVWLSTVYRILELFVQKNLVLKTTVMDNEMALYEINRYQHKHYAICMLCHKIIPMEDCPVGSLIPKLTEESFHVVGHKLEIYGYCKECGGKGNSIPEGMLSQH